MDDLKKRMRDLIDRDDWTDGCSTEGKSVDEVKEQLLNYLTSVDAGELVKEERAPGTPLMVVASDHCDGVNFDEGVIGVKFKLRMQVCNLKSEDWYAEGVFRASVGGITLVNERLRVDDDHLEKSITVNRLVTKLELKVGVRRTPGKNCLYLGGAISVRDWGLEWQTARRDFDVTCWNPPLKQ